MTWEKLLPMLKKAGVKGKMDIAESEQPATAPVASDEMDLDDFLSINYNPASTGQANGYPQKNNMEYNY